MVHGRLKERQESRPVQENKFSSMNDLNTIRSSKPRTAALPGQTTAGVKRHNSLTADKDDQKKADIARSRSVNLGHNDSGYPHDTVDGKSLLSGKLSIARFEVTPISTARGGRNMHHANETKASANKHTAGNPGIPLMRGGQKAKDDHSVTNKTDDNESLPHFSPVGNRLSAIAAHQVARPGTHVSVGERKGGVYSSTPNREAAASIAQRRSSMKIVSDDTVKDVRNDILSYSRHNTAKSTRPNQTMVSRRASRLSANIDSLTATPLQQAGKDSELKNGASSTHLTKDNPTIGVDIAPSRQSESQNKRPATATSMIGAKQGISNDTTNSIKPVPSRPGSIMSRVNKTTPPVPLTNDTNTPQNGRLKTAMVRRGTRPTSQVYQRIDKTDNSTNKGYVISLVNDLDDKKVSNLSKTNGSAKHQTFVKNK